MTGSDSKHRPIDIIVSAGPILRGIILLPILLLALGVTWMISDYLTAFRSRQLTLFSIGTDILLTLGLLWIYLKIAEETSTQSRLMEEEQTPDVRVTVDIPTEAGPALVIKNVGRGVATDVSIEWVFNERQYNYYEPFLSPGKSLQFSLLDDIEMQETEEEARLSDILLAIDEADANDISYELKYGSTINQTKSVSGSIEVSEKLLAHSGVSYSSPDEEILQE